MIIIAINFNKDIKTIKRLQKITFLFIYVYVAYYLLINASGIISQWNTAWSSSLLFYLVGVSIFLGIDEKIPIELGSEKSINKNSTLKIFIGFSLALLISLILFWVLYDLGWYFQGIQSMPVKYIPANLLYQSMVVVASETIIFQGVIYRYFSDVLDWRYGALISAVSFSVFHSAVYQANFGAFIMAFILGLVFVLSVRRWNIGVPMGIHLAWNGIVLGMFILPK